MNDALMRNITESTKNSVVDLILRYGLLRDERLKERIREDLLAAGYLEDSVSYSQQVFDIFVAIGSEFIRGRRPATSDIKILTSFPRSSARRGMSILERGGVIVLLRDPSDGRRNFVVPTEPYQRLIESFVDECAVEFKEIIDLFDMREREAAELKYKSLFDNATAGIGRTLLSDGKVFLANKKLAEMFGYDSVEEFIEEFKFSEHYAEPDGRERELAHRRKSPSETYEVMLTRRDGSTIYVQGDAVLNDESGYIDFVVIDITERKQTEKALEETLAWLEEAQRIGQVGHWIYDEIEDKEQYVSQEAYRIFGMEDNQTLSSWDEFLETVHPDDRERVSREQIEASETGTSYECEYRIVLPNGEIRFILERGEPVFDDTGRLIQSVGTGQDITERRERETALRESETHRIKVSEAKFRSLIEQIPLGVSIEDYSGTKQIVDRLRSEGVSDLRNYFADNEDVLLEAVMAARVTDANTALLKMFGTPTLQDYIDFDEDYDIWQGSPWIGYYIDEISSLAEGNTPFASIYSDTKPDGSRIDRFQPARNQCHPGLLFGHAAEIATVAKSQYGCAKCGKEKIGYASNRLQRLLESGERGRDTWIGVMEVKVFDSTTPTI